MSLLEELKNLEIDVDEGLERMMGNNALYEKVLGMFVDLVLNSPVSLEDFSGADLSTLIKQIHVLKDVTGTLSITPLFKKYTQALNLLQTDQAAEAKEKYEQLLPAQVKIIACIKRHMEGQRITD